jgi:glycosyltransferase involved in cell wall biosynthesis
VRLLFLAPFPPRLDGRHGGARVVAQTVAGLAARHEVALVYLRGPGEEPADDLGAEVHQVPRRALERSLARRARQARALLAGRPVWVDEWANPEFGARAGELAATWRPDVVQIEYHVMGQYTGSLGGHRAARVLDLPEVGTLAAEDARRRGGAASPLHALDARNWRRYERAILEQVDAATVYAERDRTALERLGSTARIVRVPIGVTPPPRALEDTGAPPPTILFVGSFRHPPNIDAALRLAERIQPLVRARCSGAVLTIVGELPPRRLLQLASDDVVVTGPVPDVTPYLEAATVVAAPIRFGGGIRLKVLEALAAGKAVVASELAAAEALGPHLVLAETDGEFAERICLLLGDADERARLGAAARAWALEHARPERTIAAYEELYSSLLGREG